MIEVKVTKSRLTDYLRVFRLVLGICDTFTIINDIIQPVEITDDIVTGAHRIMHPLFPVTKGYVFESVPNIKDILNDIRDKKGAKNTSIINDDNALFIRIDYEDFVLATVKKLTDSTKTFSELIAKWVPDQIRQSYSQQDLSKAKLGEVITVGNDEYGMVRLSKSSFPFIGVSRSADEANFSGGFALGTIDPDMVRENYIASHIKYKYCEALHMYIYVPYTA